MEIKGTNYSFKSHGNKLVLNWKKSKKDYFDSVIFLVTSIAYSSIGIIAIQSYLKQSSFVVLIAVACFFLAGVFQSLKLLDKLSQPINSILKIEKDIDLITVKRPFFSKKKIKISQVKNIEAKLISEFVNINSIGNKRHYVELNFNLINNKKQSILTINPTNIIKRPIENVLKKNANSIGKTLGKELNVSYNFISSK